MAALLILGWKEGSWRHRWACGHGSHVAPCAPEQVAVKPREDSSFLITLISFPCWSLISKMQAVVMNPALR